MKNLLAGMYNNNPSIYDIANVISANLYLDLELFLADEMEKVHEAVVAQLKDGRKINDIYDGIMQAYGKSE